MVLVPYHCHYAAVSMCYILSWTKAAPWWLGLTLRHTLEWNCKLWLQYVQLLHVHVITALGELSCVALSFCCVALPSIRAFHRWFKSCTKPCHLSSTSLPWIHIHLYHCSQSYLAAWTRMIAFDPFLELRKEARSLRHHFPWPLYMLMSCEAISL